MIFWIITCTSTTRNRYGKRQMQEMKVMILCVYRRFCCASYQELEL